MNYINFNLIIKIRNFYINNFKVNIVGFIKNNKNEIILSKPRFIYILNVIPFITTILNLFKINCLIKKDNLYFLLNKKKGGIIPIIINFWVKNTFDFKENFNKYGNNVPIEIIFKNENILLDNEDEIIVKYFKSGKVLEKSFNYKKIKLFSKIDLLK